VAAAWEEARRRLAGVPRIAAGFSFGAAMSLLAAAEAFENQEPLPAALALIGIPLRLFSLPRPFPAPLPLAAVHGERDQFTPPEAVKEYLSSWPGPVAFDVFPDADHFLEGHLVEATAFLRDHIKESL
jgi:alpha/beta superfamily hydrolase